MANTKVTSHVIANNAISASMIQSAAVTDAKLHATLDLSGKTLTLPATAIPSASTATTQAASDNSTKIATTAYVTTAIDNLVDSAPGALNTLNELAAALGDDASFSSTITTSIATKLPLAGGTLTGNLVLSGAPTSGLHPATKTYTDTADALKLNLSGGTLTGDLTINTTGALKLPAGTTGQRPTAATGQIRWNSTDGALEVYNGSAWTAVGTGSSNKVLDTFTGDGSTDTFTLSVTPANEDAIMVFIDGAYQEKSDYVLTNNSLELDTAPLNNEKIAVHTITASVHDGTSAVNQQFTGDGSTTDFTLSQDPKSENNTHIYINGVYQQKTDYTVTGTTLAFDTAPTNGDIIEVNMFTVATLGNTDTVTEGVSNLYHTTARARGAISVSGNAISYNSSTGVLTANFEEGPVFTGDVRVSGTLGIGANASNVIGVYSTKSLANGLAAEFTNSESSTGSGLVVRGGNNSSTYSADFRDYNSNSLMRIRGDGNVGIGTGAPGYKLEVNGTAHVVNTLTAGSIGIPSQGITLNQAFGTGVPTMTMLGTVANGRAGAIYFQENGAANTAAIYSTDGAGGNANYGGLMLATYQSDIRFSTGGLSSTRMIIKSDGKVGIGIDGPGSLLHVDKSHTGSALVTFHQTAGSSSADRGLDVETSSTGTTVQRWINSGVQLMSVQGSGAVDIKGGNLYLTGNNDRRIKLSDSGVAGVSDSNNTVHIRGDNDYMKLNAAGNGGWIFEENGTEKMRIASNAVYSNARATAGFLMAEITKQHLGNDSNGTGDITITVVCTNQSGVYDAFQVMLYLNHTGNSAPIEHAQYLIEGYQRSSSVYHQGTTHIAGDSRPISVSTSGLTMTITIQSEGSSTATQGVYARALGNYYGISSIS